MERDFMNIKINDTLCPATVRGIQTIYGDFAFGNRETKAITLEMDNATAATLFVDDVKWGVVYPDKPDFVDDMSDYCLAGAITDNRDGTVTVKMGKKTDGEMQRELLEVLNND
jgi:hypothetical protein